MRKERVILGKSWLKKHNPEINWVDDSIYLPKFGITLKQLRVNSKDCCAWALMPMHT